MKIFIQHRHNTPYVQRLVKEISKLVEVEEHDAGSKCTHYLSLQMGGEQQIISLRQSLPDAKITTYCWDCYEWIWEHARMYDWRLYGEQCRVSDLIMVPSYGQVLRLGQHWDIIPDKTLVIPAYAQLFDYNNIGDDGYVCDPLRDIPDRHSGWVRRACSELDIPYQHGGNNRPWEEYKKFVGRSSFVVCPWYEASTGGMSLVEAYSIGKDVLVCDSPYMGAKEYFGDRAYYFEPSYESLKNGINVMWKQRGKPKSPTRERREFCHNEFGVATMARNLVAALESHYD